MKSTTRTRVLKSHPAIKALIARSFPDACERLGLAELKAS
jgi:hypothetical protein